MAYIGKEPADSFISFAKQDFTTSATTSYTLDNAVTNENELALFINFVRQEPTTAYTASGTTLTLTSATASSDDMYCVYLGKAIQTVNPPSGSVGSSQVASTIITGQTAETSIATDDTVLIHDTSAGALRKMTRANFVSGVGGTNTPTFLVRKNGDQSISANTATKITGWTEIFDPQSTFASDKFTPGVAGKYFIYGYVYLNGIDGERFMVALHKNGTNFVESGSMASAANNYPQLVCGYVELGASDYVELYFTSPGGTSTAYSSGITVQWGGYKIIE